MNILVAGGAGYIGSHMVRTLERSGHDVVVVDNLSAGFRQSVSESSQLVVGNIADLELMKQVLGDHKVEAVMHFAANALVGESVIEPAKYYQNNVAASLQLFDAMLATDVKKIVFSSTCATYGIPESVPITEQTPQHPVNPYGESKLMVEKILDAYASAYGFGFAALRYFNAAGASPDGDIGEDHSPESHLIPIVLDVALGKRDKITIFGDDWPTADGTCVRDYIHVDDLGSAHLAALERLESGTGLKLNLGTGVGFSVRQIVDLCREITGHEIPEVIGERRPGDPPELVADASLARSVLDWSPQYESPKSIIETAWNWHRTHPDGYRSKAGSGV